MTDNTFTRVDPLMVHDALLYGPHRQDAADYACAALRAAYAEMDRLTADVEYWKQQQIEACAEGNGLAIQCEQLEAERDRLRANALEWVTVTEDPATLPPVDEIVVIRLFAGGTYMGVLDDFSLLRWQVRGPYLTSFQVGVGDRWAYIPEPPNANN